MSNFRPAAVDHAVLVNVRTDMAIFDALPNVVQRALAMHGAPTPPAMPWR